MRSTCATPACCSARSRRHGCCWRSSTSCEFDTGYPSCLEFMKVRVVSSSCMCVLCVLQVRAGQASMAAEREALREPDGYGQGEALQTRQPWRRHVWLRASAHAHPSMCAEGRGPRVRGGAGADLASEPGRASPAHGEGPPTLRHHPLEQAVPGRAAHPGHGEPGGREGAAQGAAGGGASRRPEAGQARPHLRPFQQPESTHHTARR